MAATVLDVCKRHPPQPITVIIIYYIKYFLMVSKYIILSYPPPKKKPMQCVHVLSTFFAAVVIENHGHAALASIRECLQKNYMPTILLIDLDVCPYVNQLVHPSISLLQDVVKELKAGTLHDVAPVGTIISPIFFGFSLSYFLHPKNWKGKINVACYIYSLFDK
jgi:hypothetical protein